MTESIEELKVEHLLSKPQLRLAVVNVEDIIEDKDAKTALFTIKHLADAIKSYDQVIDRLFSEIEKLQKENGRWNGLRPEVQWFAEQMELALRDNDHKTGWKDEHQSWLLAELHRNAGKIFDSGYSIRRTVNVANFAMMIADNARNKAKP